MNFGRFFLRVALGGFFIGHGTQKLLGWFGGHGIEGTGQFFEQLGMRPGRRNAIAAGAAEAGGGAAIVLGFETPLAASALTATMLTAIHRVHLKNGPWISGGGYEYNVVLIAAALALAETGPGKPSLDSALGHERYGKGWALAALITGALGAIGTHLAAEAQPAAPAPPPVPEPADDGAAATEARPA